MATRSLIGITDKTGYKGTVEYVYCHWDGQLGWNGNILLNHYNRKKAEKLIDYAHENDMYISELEKSPKKCKWNSADPGQVDVAMQKQYFKFAKKRHLMVMYVYVIDSAGDWWYAKPDSDDWIFLDEAEIEHDDY